MNNKGSIYLKKAISTLLCIVLCFSMACGTLTVGASEHTTKGSTVIGAEDVVQGYIEGITDSDWYSVVPTEETYYKFSIRNQSAELRTGIAYLDFMFNLFFGELSVEIFDEYDDRLAATNVRCGYTNSVSVKLYPGHTYSVKVTSTISGNYRISTKTIADIGPDSWEEALEVEPNGNFVSSVDANTDEDWYVFTSDAERSFYNFSLENLSKTGYQELWLYEYVAGAGEIPWRDITNFSVSSGRTSSVSLQLKENTKYCYCILGTAGGYVLDVEQTLDVAGPSFETAYKMELDTEYTTSVDGTNDVDYFSFTTDSDNAYYHVNFELLSADVGATVSLYDSMGTLIDDDYRYTTGTLSYNALLKPNSTYYLSIKGFNPGNYTFSVDKKADIYFDDKENATPIEFGKKYSSSFDGSDDKDYLCFTTDSDNAYYHINFDVLSSDVGATVALYDNDGNLIDDDYRYTTGKITYNALLKPDSNYYLLLTGFNAGNYAFSVDKKVDIYFNNKEKATSIEFGKKYESSFDGNNDVDYICFTTSENNAYYHISFDLLSSDVGATVALYDSIGTLIDDGYSYHSGKIKFNALLAPSSTYYLVLSAFNPGNYSFSVDKKVDIYFDDKERATAIQLNKEYKSSFDGKGDADYLKFETAEYNVAYSLEMNALSSCYYEVRLYDADGAEIASNYAYHGGEKTVIADLEPSSLYYVKLVSNDNESMYTFRATSERDYEGNTRDEAKQINLNGTYEGKLGNASDIDWFKITAPYDDDYRIYVDNETDSIEIHLYNSREGLEYNRSVRYDLDDTKFLEAGTYYIRVSRYTNNPKYYSIVIADCGNGHKEKSVYSKKAGIGEVGTKKIVCSKCGKLIRTEKVAAIKSIKISATSFTYTGSTRRPTVTITDTEGKKISSYSVKWSNSGSKSLGSYTMTVTLSGAYSGSKTYRYNINLATPKVKNSGTTKANKVSWSKVPGAKGYIVYCRYYKNKKWSSWTKIATTTKRYYDHKKAVSGRYYQYEVKAFNKNFVSASKASVKAMRLAAPSVKTAKSGKYLKVSWGKSAGATKYVVYRRTYNSKKGKWSGWSKVKTTTSRSYTDKKVKKGTKYQYTVTATATNSKSSQKIGKAIKR
ncbi:MAG: hypothetical protein IJP22_02955 [Clostridia bacterium]|nr:hypothetical protein [Clostridia bacterium]